MRRISGAASQAVLARTATLDAARDLYGAGSTQHTTVAAAWDAVSVR